MKNMGLKKKVNLSLLTVCLHSQPCPSDLLSANAVASCKHAASILGAEESISIPCALQSPCCANDVGWG